MTLEGRRVLVVENDATVAFDVANIIKGAKAEVLGPAATLAEAIRLAQSHSPSMAVLDFQLGAENSLPLADKLHASRVPFLFLTSHKPEQISKFWPRVPILCKLAPARELIRVCLSLTGVAIH